MKRTLDSSFKLVCLVGLALMIIGFSYSMYQMPKDFKNGVHAEILKQFDNCSKLIEKNREYISAEALHSQERDEALYDMIHD